MLPISVAVFPSNLLNNFPIFNPKNVKRKLVIEKITGGKNKTLLIVPSPIPTVKLSMLTVNPNKNKELILFRGVTSSSLNVDKNI